jgi:hypothetical protein
MDIDNTPVERGRAVKFDPWPWSTRLNGAVYIPPPSDKHAAGSHDEL